jgi:chemotaxis protein MotB
MPVFSIPLSGLTASSTALSTIANNLANLNTVGYKDARVLFQDLFYSSSQVDRRKVGKLAVAIQVAFQELGVFQASTSRIPMDNSEPMPFNTVQAIENVDRTAALGKIAPAVTGRMGGVSESGDLSGLRKELEQALAPEITRREVAVRQEADGLVISLQEVGFFDSGSADIKSTSERAFGRIASLLLAREYRVRIEGHTDNVPIHTVKFASNWELSTARATELVRVLVENYHFLPTRLSAAGYAEYHPIATNATVEGRQLNRRVDIVVLGVAPTDSTPSN